MLIDSIGVPARVCRFIQSTLKHRQQREAPTDTDGATGLSVFSGSILRMFRAYGLFWYCFSGKQSQENLFLPMVHDIHTAGLQSSIGSAKIVQKGRLAWWLHQGQWWLLCTAHPYVSVKYTNLLIFI